jgi:hypothetical protein
MATAGSRHAPAARFIAYFNGAGLIFRRRKSIFVFQILSPFLLGPV